MLWNAGTPTRKVANGRLNAAASARRAVGPDAAADDDQAS